MSKNRLLLLAGLLIISIASFVYMNMNYDILARNTYVTSANRSLLLEKLNDDEILYIVENNVDVNKFYEFLQDDLFVFDHYELYGQAKKVRPSDTHTIVTFVNAVESTLDFESILEALKYYDYPVLRKMLVDHSPYNNQAEIVLNPDDVSLQLGLNNTIGEYEPTDLISLKNYSCIPTIDQEIKLRKEAADSLNLMCVYLETMTNEKCGGFTVTQGYLSYDDIQQNYLEAISEYGAQQAFEMWGWPSHNEHRLGLSVDIELQEDIPLEDSEQYNFLLENVSRYGFTFYEEADFSHLEEPYHMRYIGY
ncbi:MAG: D-alanyl-D-alanine carboxypeptidase family protein [Erysipelotrichales bacterium]|nr:D-alanyl-D-alanine carboxypeptidase family protein [Erysipelotrichales bacterium]